ncbi:hypothetical protein B296_00018962, partial [Ensete ventricosum]
LSYCCHSRWASSLGRDAGGRRRPTVSSSARPAVDSSRLSKRWAATGPATSALTASTGAFSPARVSLWGELWAVNAADTRPRVIRSRSREIRRRSRTQTWLLWSSTCPRWSAGVVPTLSCFSCSFRRRPSYHIYLRNSIRVDRF